MMMSTLLEVRGLELHLKHLCVFCSFCIQILYISSSEISAQAPPRNYRNPRIDTPSLGTGLSDQARDLTSNRYSKQKGVQVPVPERSNHSFEQFKAPAPVSTRDFNRERFNAVHSEDRSDMRQRVTTLVNAQRYDTSERRSDRNHSVH